MPFPNAKELTMAGAKIVNSATAQAGDLGAINLASGQRLSMRLWRDEEPHPKTAVRRDYETVGFVISGKAELIIAGEATLLAAGDSWVVPAGAEHTYRIVEKFTAIEATAPPTHGSHTGANADPTEETAMDDDHLDMAVAGLRREIASARDRLSRPAESGDRNGQAALMEMEIRLARYEAEQLKRASDFGK
jgi:mannose-6-phosphate isomerase-like protein (cupin superfamily)